MFNKDLFFSLCEKYDVELSKTINKPMIKMVIVCMLLHWKM